jgi:hypothetical protein
MIETEIQVKAEVEIENKASLPPAISLTFFSPTKLKTQNLKLKTLNPQHPNPVSSTFFPTARKIYTYEQHISNHSSHTNES